MCPGIRCLYVIWAAGARGRRLWCQGRGQRKCIKPRNKREASIHLFTSVKLGVGHPHKPDWRIPMTPGYSFQLWGVVGRTGLGGPLPLPWGMKRTLPSEVGLSPISSKAVNLNVPPEALPNNSHSISRSSKMCEHGTWVTRDMSKTHRSRSCKPEGMTC